jgi:hypothetical protein
MKRVLIATSVAAALCAGMLPRTASAACTATGFFRDGNNMTAAQIGGDVTTTLDASGCNIGVYYDNTTSGNVTGATIFGANYFGVVVNGDVGSVSVNVTGSTIRDIGETPLNGTQHGNAIYYRALGAGTARGIVSGNTVFNYQKGGIIANGGGISVTISNNAVTGQGAVGYIAQNGIQLGYGAKATVTGNTVTGNAYTGAGGVSSAGILILGGPFFTTCGSAGTSPCPYTVGVNTSKNTLSNNDVGLWLFNAGSGAVAPSTATNNTAKFNTIFNGQVTNTTGNTANCGYQAGIADLGNKDLIVNNSISGFGYTPQVGGDCTGNPPAFLRFIDVTTKARGTPSNK